MPCFVARFRRWSGRRLGKQAWAMLAIMYRTKTFLYRKMGLKGVQGIRYATAPQTQPSGQKRPTAAHEINHAAPPRRLRHQGMPESQRRDPSNLNQPPHRQNFDQQESTPSRERKPPRGIKGPHAGAYRKQNLKIGKAYSNIS